MKIIEKLNLNHLVRIQILKLMIIINYKMEHVQIVVTNHTQIIALGVEIKFIII